MLKSFRKDFAFREFQNLVVLLHPYVSLTIIIVSLLLQWPPANPPFSTFPKYIALTQQPESAIKLGFSMCLKIL